MTLTLEVQKRDQKAEDNAALRSEGFVPGVFYGPKEESTAIKIKTADFTKAYKEAGESTVVTLKEGSAEHDALIHDIDRDPVKGDIRHVDFYVIEKGKKVTVHVPLEFVGESQGEKAGGSLVKVMHEVEIEASPKDLPHNIEVSLEALTEVGSQIHGKDLVMPNGVALKTDPEETIALIQEAKEEEDIDAEAPDLSSVEVAGEKKEEEGEKAE